MNSRPIKISPNFIVPDVVATAKYYCDVLGFTSVRYDGDPPVFALVEWGDVSIMFKSYLGVKTAISNQKVHEDVGWDVYLWVTDVQSACAESARMEDASCARSRRPTTAVVNLRSKISTVSYFASASNYPPSSKKPPNKTGLE